MLKRYQELADLEIAAKRKGLKAGASNFQDTVVRCVRVGSRTGIWIRSTPQSIYIAMRPPGFSLQSGKRRGRLGDAAQISAMQVTMLRQPPRRHFREHCVCSRAHKYIARRLSPRRAPFAGTIWRTSGGSLRMVTARTRSCTTWPTSSRSSSKQVRDLSCPFRRAAASVSVRCVSTGVSVPKRDVAATSIVSRVLARPCRQSSAAECS